MRLRPSSGRSGASKGSIPANLPWGMWGVGGHVTKEGLRFVLFHPGDCGVGQGVDDEALRLDEGLVVLQGWIEIVIPMAGAKTEEFLEALTIGIVGKVGPVVPFAKAGGGIPGFGEGFGKSGFPGAHGFEGSGYPVDTGP